ncbi:LysM domain [Phytophthora infestans]|uniref:LysM domain n=1 Tax=Phytophthora infestans TaxID=4787 RepID=A0A8S9UKI5_PHYIN|nr:LysM domain [Phytophthora infestans]
MEGGGPSIIGINAESRARELRRRVGNRRRAGADVLSSPLPALTLSLPQLVYAKHEAHEIRMDLIDAQSQHNSVLKYCDQQFVIESNVRQLRKGIGETQLQIRQKTEELDELQRRVLRLSKALHDSSDEKTFAKTKLGSQEEIRKHQLHTKSCRHCGRQYLPGIAKSHEDNCTGVSLPDLQPMNQIADSLELQSQNSLSLPTIKKTPDAPVATRFVSQPPRNLRLNLKEITHNALAIVWDPPIFTGSNAILDYELSYAVVHSKTKQQRQFDPQPPLRLSQWCLVNPIPGDNYRLTNLSADQEYGEFALCVITVAGKSEPSNKVEIIRTQPSIPPTTPLFLCVGVVSATSITLTWVEPLDDGGRSVQDYEVIFSEAIINLDNVDNRGKAWLNVSEIEYRPRRIRTNSTRTSLTITNLLSGGEHLNFQVRAVNSEGVQGDYCEPIKSIFTIAPGNEFKLLDELQAAVNSRSRTVDSQFLSGFMQRYERHHYIQQVSRIILSMHPELETKVSDIINRTETSKQENEEANDQDQQPQAIQQATGQKQFDDLTDEEKVCERRRQFHFRVAAIRNDLKKADYNVQWCKDRQIDLVALIRSAESRILEKQAELERARMFKGPQMDSDVFENGLQRFFTKELIVALEDEVEIDQLYILDTKSEIVLVENYLRADIKRRDTLLKRLKDRQEALGVFESSPRNTAESTRTAATLAKLRGGLLYRAFAAFVSNRKEAHEIRRKICTAINRLVNHRLRSAVQQWRDVAKYLTRTSAGVGEIFGIGSIGLLNAALGRDDLMIETQKLLHELRSTGTSLQDIRWTTEQQLASKTEKPLAECNADLEQAREQNKKYFYFLLEGDAKGNLQDYESALRLYNFVLGNDLWMQQMTEAQRVQLQLKIGEATFRLENHEQALTIFNRASIMANRAGLCYEEGSALLRIADIQRLLRSLRISIENYERALLLFEAVRNTQGELSCYRGLQHVYERLEDREMAEINRHHADDIEFVLAKKLSSASQKMNKLQQRLVGAGAEPSCQIILERVGPIVPRLRRERIQRKLDIREETKLISSLEILLSEKKALLAKGEDDLKRALASDSTQVDSTVISGSNARYDVEDFKKKLAKLLGGVRAGQEQVNKDIANAKIRISNAEDEIKSLEEELAVETGPLMRKVLSREKLRCFRFNATNEALKNVVGTASHGITTCVASAGVNGLLFDFLSGACLAQAVGDPEKNHLGEPTGHQAQILCVYYIGHRIYTGSADASLGVWDVKNESIGGFSCSLTRMLMDFDAAVVSVVADTQWFACGCSDCDVFVFDAESLATIAHIISAHDRTVTTLSIQSAKSALTTGAGDNKIKVWELGKASQFTARRNVKLLCCLEADRRGDEYFNGHLAPVSCVRRVANEIVSGDTSGRIVIWNLDSDNKLLRICDVHCDVAVTCLQFDATRIISGASNGQICVIDFATGHLIQTMYGHQDGILDLQCDRTRLISMSADGKVRLWFWQTRDGVGADRKKYHIVGAGETLRSLSLMYRTSVQKLLQWNSIPDSTKIYLGQKLIVEVDTNVSASDELKTLDLSSSVQFGKLSYENLDFVASNQTKSKDVEAQWAAQRLALLAKEYFPSLDDKEANDDKEKAVEVADEEGESDSEDMALDENDDADEATIEE